jgi:hypothetical protein
MTQQSRFQSRKKVLALLAHGRKRATKASKSHSPIMTTESPRDFLLDFHHANIPFSKILVERNS